MLTSHFQGRLFILGPDGTYGPDPAGLGTTLMLLLIGGLFGVSLRWFRKFSQQEVQEIGAQTGSRTLFFGGLLFGLAGIATLLGWDRRLPVIAGYVLIVSFIGVIALPAFIYSMRQVLALRAQPEPHSYEHDAGAE